MIRASRWLPAFFAVVLPASALAQASSIELSDGLLERAVHESDRKLEKVSFERAQLEERRGFLRALKALPPAQRAPAWRRFREQQKQEEKRFHNGLELKTSRVVEKGDA